MKKLTLALALILALGAVLTLAGCGRQAPKNTENTEAPVIIVDKIGDAGLYQTGTNYNTLLKSWNDLVAEGIITSEGRVADGKETELVGDLKLPTSMTTIPTAAFRQCTELTGVYIPDGVIKINGAAFADCENLEKYRVPQSVEFIGAYAFTNCDGLKSIHYEGSKEEWRALTDEKKWNPHENVFIVFCNDGPLTYNGADPV